MWGLAVVIALYFYVRLAMWIARKLAGRRESRQWKWVVRIAVALVFVLIPTWDIILGHLYLNHLCSTEAGVKVYQTVELPAEYWDEHGAVKFPLVKDNYISSYKENRISRFFQIDRSVYSLSDKLGKVLVEDVVFRNWGGWVVRAFSPHNTAVSCGAGSMNVVFKRNN